MDSNKEIIKPYLNQLNNSVDLDFGTKFKIKRVSTNGTERDVKLMDSIDDNAFNALFDVEDIDFQIVVDNIFSCKGICYTVRICQTHNRKHYLRSGHFNEHKSLDSSGRQLHFKSRSTEEEKQMIEMRAKTLGISSENYRIRCSRIGFTVEVDKGFVSKGEEMRVHFENMCHRVLSVEDQLQRKDKFDLRVGADNTVHELKRLIDSSQGIPTLDFNLFLNGKPLYDSNALNVYDITDGSLLHLYPRLVGGRNATEAALTDMFGTRGLILLGRRTGLRTGSKDYGFKANKNVIVKQFCIDLRFNDEI